MGQLSRILIGVISDKKERKMKRVVLFLLLTVSAFAQTVTMTRTFQQCYPAGGTPVPYLAGQWSYPGCTTVTAYKYGYGSTPTNAWGCDTGVTLQHIVINAQCTCVDQYRVASTLTANKVGNQCSPTGTTFPVAHRCDFTR